MASSKTIPHSFVLDLLFERNPTVKRMFGVHSIYLGELLVLAVRHHEKFPEDNGVWIGTYVEFHDELKAEIPSLTNLTSIPIKKWLLIPEMAETFEEDVTKVCDLVLANDPRIGVLAKPKKKKIS